MATWHPPRSTNRPLPVAGLGTLRIAAVVASMVLVGTLVARGSLGLTREQPERVVRVDRETGLILDEGAGLGTGASGPLFDDVQLMPGEAVSACIRVDYAGDIDPDAVAMELSSVDGPAGLAEHLRVSVQRGDASERVGGCEGFVPELHVGSGSLSQLAAGRDATRTWPSWDPDRGESSTWYRITVTLDRSVGGSFAGAEARTDFVWSALDEAGGASLSERAALLALTVARDAALPLLALVITAILFLGIQDRIDRRDPKLALAPVTLEPLVFHPPTPDATAPTPSTERGRRTQTTGGTR